MAGLLLDTRVQARWVLIPAFAPIVGQAYIFAATHQRTDARLNRIFDPFFVSYTLCFATVLVTVALVGFHRRTLRRPGPGADAAIRANVVREGRFLLAAGALGAALTAGVGVVATRAIDRAAGWDLAVALVLPALAVVVFDLVTGVRDVRRPDRVLAPTRTAAPAWPLPSYIGFVWGSGLVIVGLIGAFLGDGVPGMRTFTEDGQPGIEGPVVVARVAVLPFMAGAAAALGWVLVAAAARTAGGRLAVLAAGAVLTTWVAALTEPVTGHSDRWLWYGAAPGLLIALGAPVLLRRRRGSV